jgi:EmrB/QacA subfamily drug resistance transporter
MKTAQDSPYGFSRYLIFGTVSIALILMAISGTAITVAFPVITDYFQTSLVLAGWIVSIQSLAWAVTMPLFGKICDVLGRKRTFMLCLALFGVGSLLSALATNIYMLIFFRLIQGIGAGGFVPAGSLIVVDAFPKQRQQVIGLFTTIFPIGQIVGPNLGGWLVETYGWQSTFWFNIPFVALAIVSAAVLLRHAPRQSAHIDLVGAGLVMGTVSSLMVGLSALGGSGRSTTLEISLPCIVIAIVLALIFVRHERRAKDPVIDLVILQDRRFVAANGFNLLFGAAMFFLLTFTSLYAIDLYGMTIFQSGLIVTPRSVGMLVAGTVTALFLPRWGYRRPILVGIGLMIVSMVLLGLHPQEINFAGLHIGSLAILIVLLLTIGVGLGMAAPASNNACIELMPERIATITGVRGMFRQTGGAIAIPVTTILLHNIADPATGFFIVFVGFSGLLLFAMALAFVMPTGPNCDTGQKRPIPLS